MHYWPERDREEFEALSPDGVQHPSLAKLREEVFARNAVEDLGGFLIRCESQFRVPHGFDGTGLQERLSAEYAIYKDVSLDQLPSRLQYFISHITHVCENLRSHDLDCFPGSPPVTLFDWFGVLEHLYRNARSFSTGVARFQTNKQYVGRPLLAIWDDRGRAPRAVVSELIPDLDLERQTFLRYSGRAGRMVHALSRGTLNPSLSLKDQPREFLEELYRRVIPKLDEALAYITTLQSEKIAFEILAIRRKIGVQVQDGFYEGMSREEVLEMNQADFSAVMSEYEHALQWRGEVIAAMEDLCLYVHLASLMLNDRKSPTSTLELVQNTLKHLADLIHTPLEERYANPGYSVYPELSYRRSA